MDLAREPSQPIVRWQRRRRLIRQGLKDLKYLPPHRSGWNATLAAVAYGFRRQLADRPDLNLWAAMHALPASGRYADLGRGALVLWHATSAARAEKIRQVGLFPRKGIWATAEPRLAHSFTRWRAAAHEAGSAMICLLFDREEMPVPFEPASEPDTLRFRSRIGPEFVEYVLWDDRIEFTGAARARRPRPWGVARFKKRAGRWVPRSRPPVRFDQEHSYGSLEEWLELSVERVLRTLGAAAAVEVFSCLYATIDPREALSHEEVFAALERLCGRSRQGPGGARQFALADAR